MTHDILHSSKGVGGGYSLKRNVDEISLPEVIEASGGPLVITLPTIEGVQSPATDLRLRHALEQANATRRSQLDAIKLSDLLGTGAGRLVDDATAHNQSAG